VDPTWWGAVVSDPRYPRVQEANYARVETTRPVRLSEIEAELLPALGRSRCRRSHVVVFHPERQTDLLAQASTRGARLAWDLVMLHGGAVALAPDDPVQEIRVFDDAFRLDLRASTRLFDVSDEGTLDELSALEIEVLVPAGRRWFVVRDRAGRAVAFSALLLLDGVGFVDHVLTLPEARRRGHATALTRRVLAESRAAEAERTYLLAEPGGVAAHLYARLGFERVAHIASWISPLPGDPAA
jgi:ribosomal protein S18 acetylase RimI-like enzyme